MLCESPRKLLVGLNSLVENGFFLCQNKYDLRRYRETLNTSSLLILSANVNRLVEQLCFITKCLMCALMPALGKCSMLLSASASSHAFVLQMLRAHFDV